MSTLRGFLMTVLVGGLLSTSSLAFADGISVSSGALSNDARTKLENDIAQAKVSMPKAFDAVKNVKGHRPEHYRKNRNPYPTVSRELRGLGAPALLPMLEALAFQAPARGSLTDAEWDALASGMLEAVGVLRDSRSGPVLKAIFESGSVRPQVRAAAARALGRLGGDAEAALLISHAKRGDSAELDAVQGLGEMLRLDGAKHLAQVLATTKDPAVAEAAATALGTAGSSWAWRSLGPKAEATGLEVRKVCAAALADRFVASRGKARTAIAESVLIVDHPDTVAFLTQVRDKDRVAVDALVARVERQRKRSTR
ncbi:MAG: hypothetical protein U0263_03635 [Polyangiaceae bacterium]